MGLKIHSTKKTPDQEPQTPHNARLARIRRFIEEDEFLRDFFRQDHPLLVWEPICLSESLTYRLSFRHKPEVSVIGCAVLFNLNDYYPDLVQKDQFRATFTRACRHLSNTRALAI